jgi:hypothetical protein
VRIRLTTNSLSERELPRRPCVLGSSGQ